MRRIRIYIFGVKMRSKRSSSFRREAPKSMLSSVPHFSVIYIYDHDTEHVPRLKSMCPQRFHTNSTSLSSNLQYISQISSKETPKVRADGLQLCSRQILAERDELGGPMVAGGFVRCSATRPDKGEKLDIFQVIAVLMTRTRAKLSLSSPTWWS